MSDIGPVDEQSAGLCRVLEPIVATFRIDDPAAAARLGVQTILPAVITLRALQEAPVLGPWHGLIHRRCRICPAGGGAESPVSETASETVIDTRTRAGWWLVRARTAVGAGRAGERWPDGAVVVHDLARRLDDGDSASPRAPGPLPAVQNAPVPPIVPVLAYDRPRRMPVREGRGNRRDRESRRDSAASADSVDSVDLANSVMGALSAMGARCA
mgnify:CR=1 FL=1